jgi:aryl-alcohol dehydrogenase-like predicted oxidoreductase
LSETGLTERRLLGRTNLEVSALSLGTVELGTDYGIRQPGQPGRPDRAESIRLLEYAADRGINLFDTAPAYGDSEKLLGEALGRRNDCHFATKVSMLEKEGKPLSGKPLRKAVSDSLEASLRTLRRDFIDIVQIHNATVETIERGEITEALLKARDAGKIRFLGASVYGEEAALAVIKAGDFDTIQLAYNLLDQRMAGEVFPAACEANIGVICRSALLKGALTERARWLPEELAPLREQVTRAVNSLAGSWEKLPQIALRFCLSSSHISTVLVGASSRQELDAAIEAAAAGPLSNKELEIASGLALADESLINPVNWPIP